MECRKKTNLQIKKLTEGLPAQQFEFVIRAVTDQEDNDGNLVTDDRLNGEYKTNSNEKVEFVNGVATLKIGSGDTVTIMDLPMYVPSDPNGDQEKWIFEVEETSHSDDYYTEIYVDNPDSGFKGKKTEPFALSKNTIAIYFNNIANPTGSLKVKKNGENGLNTNQVFNFTIESEDSKFNGNATKKFTNASGDSSSDGITFVDGKYETELKAGETVEFSGLPLGKYKVTEEGVEGIRASWTVVDQTGQTPTVTAEAGENAVTDNITVSDKSDATATFTNKPTTTSLELEKIVSSEETVDNEKEFEFKLDGGKKLANLKATIKYSDEENAKPFVFENDGTQTVKLRHRQRATITGLADGSEINVTENKEGGYETSSTVEIDGKTQDPQTGYSRDVTVVEDQDMKVTFLNATEPAGNLQIKKTVIGRLNVDSFDFKVTAQNGLHPEGEYVVNIYEAGNHLVSSDKISFVQEDDNWVSSLTLADNQYAVIIGLPLGNYKVEETTIDADMETRNKVDNDSWKDDTVTNDMRLKNNGDLKTAFYENRSSTGKLEVAKKAAGNLDTNKSFTFKIDSFGAVINRELDAKLVTESNSKDITISFDGVGNAEFNLKPGQYVTIDGVPFGKYEVSEQVEDGITTSWMTTSGGGRHSSDAGTVAEPIAVEKDLTSSVEFTNRPLEGDLIVSKDVLNMQAGDADKEFEFTLTVTDKGHLVEDGTFEVEGLPNKTFSFTKNDDQYEYKFVLKNGGMARFKGLPEGVPINVTETGKQDKFLAQYRIGNSGTYTKQDSEGPTVTIGDEEEQIVQYQNVRDPEGSLEITKKTDTNQLKDAEFTFTVNALNDNEELTEDFAATVENRKVTVHFVDGEMTYDLKPGQTLKIDGLPLGQYQITETGQDGIVTSYDADSGRDIGTTTEEIVKANHTTQATFTNNQTEFTLEKVVINDDNNKEEFKFLIDSEGNEALAGKTFETASGDKVKFNEEGQATMTLKAGQKETILGLPVGTKLTVTELDDEKDPGRYKVSSQVNGDDSQDGMVREVTTPEDTHTMQVTFVNSKYDVGSLKVEKQVIGNMNTETFEFEIKGLDKLALKGTYSLQKYENGQATGGRENIEFKQNDDEEWVTTITLKDNQYITIDGLPIGTYNVTEQDPKEDGMITQYQLNSGKTQDA
ncbi:DUF7601 domain-containing protein [Secundilactobacillus collinoides]|uniref:DUF7601 domain-containing protein n=1 Tax=Secundilactobacillus collinoides TaxID=33960 RepID=UPI0006D21364|nr:DUF5979 domain-containing protein [Secundilactobacillus collinoides]